MAPLAHHALHAGHGASLRGASSEALAGLVPQALAAAPSAPACGLLDDAVPVTILLTRRVEFGDRLAVVGQTPELGAWRAADGLALAWSEGDVWCGQVVLPPGQHEFKVRRALERQGVWLVARLWRPQGLHAHGRIRCAADTP